MLWVRIILSLWLFLFVQEGSLASKEGSALRQTEVKIANLENSWQLMAEQLRKNSMELPATQQTIVPTTTILVRISHGGKSPFHLLHPWGDVRAAGSWQLSKRESHFRFFADVDPSLERIKFRRLRI